ncbi:Bgt-55081 [Blumeria graminis f. sp. tritici]|uniref:Bgt-55081 n=1 Tax=Blumeria graminis f. sp. tritici TaxID=62690 RepID=A0A9X9L7I0_BLUGR|nr:Bgt-55081 [Blumeria graminis f. sp. tritici]
MKFISTVTAAALAGLLLLVPAACGNRHYICDRGDPIDEVVALRTMNNAFMIEHSHEHPAIPTGEPQWSFFFTKSLNAHRLGIACYLLQVYGDPPNYQLFQSFKKEWRRCSLEDKS